MESLPDEVESSVEPTLSSSAAGDSQVYVPTQVQTHRAPYLDTSEFDYNPWTHLAQTMATFPSQPPSHVHLQSHWETHSTAGPPNETSSASSAVTTPLAAAAQGSPPQPTIPTEIYPDRRRFRKNPKFPVWRRENPPIPFTPRNQPHPDARYLTMDDPVPPSYSVRGFVEGKPSQRQEGEQIFEYSEPYEAERRTLGGVVMERRVPYQTRTSRAYDELLFTEDPVWAPPHDPPESGTSPSHTESAKGSEQGRTSFSTQKQIIVVKSGDETRVSSSSFEMFSSSHDFEISSSQLNQVAGDQHSNSPPPHQDINYFASLDPDLPL
ncbi:hypothetical protein ONZ45_g12251 [Pleurotus djamor]|nr:hypothetical protein ONZ45_g12251 [Pleurotus djamor]